MLFEFAKHNTLQSVLDRNGELDAGRRPKKSFLYCVLVEITRCCKVLLGYRANRPKFYQEDSGWTK